MELILIAEVGQTHEGDVDLAVDAVRDFAEAGATHVKFQFLEGARIAKDTAGPYWHTAPNSSRSQVDLFDSNAIPYSRWDPIVNACDDHGVTFLATPFDTSAVQWLRTEYGCDELKIASGDITNRELLQYVNHSGVRRVYLSTGASALGEISAAMHILIDVPEVVLMACDLSYPTPFTKAQLGRIDHMTRIFHQRVGYSDHTTEVSTGFHAALLGATVLEKHCSLGGDPDVCPDHEMALDPTQFAVYADFAQEGVAIRARRSLTPAEHEIDARRGARRSLVAKHDIPAGTRLGYDNVTALRPGPLGTELPADLIVEAYEAAEWISKGVTLTQRMVSLVDDSEMT